MDSKQSGDRRNMFKLLLSLVLSVSIIFGYIKMVTYSNIKSTNKLLLSSKDTYEQSTGEVVDVYAANTYNNNAIENNKFTYNESNNNLALTKNDNMFVNWIKSINININGYAIILADKTFGYVASKNERDEIVANICKIYIDELGLSPEKISKIQLTGKIEATPQKVKLSELSNSGEISKEIYQTAIVSDDLMELSLSVNVAEEEAIEPDIIEIDDENIYMGDSEIIEGEKGSKEVYKEVVYEGLQKEDENVIDENIIAQATPTLIKRGTKNPYIDGIAFLSSPTIGGTLTSYYGENRGNSYHKGIDIAKDTGEPVSASIDGKVIYADYNTGGYGNLVIIEHDNNMKTYYAHLNEINVSVGEEVETGEVVGKIGSTGLSTGPHLHFELRIDNNPVNPIGFIKN